MAVTGVLMLVAALLMLVFMEDPFPMWLIISGCGIMFIGVGSALQRSRPAQP